MNLTKKSLRKVFIIFSAFAVLANSLMNFTPLYIQSTSAQAETYPRSEVLWFPQIGRIGFEGEGDSDGAFLEDNGSGGYTLHGNIWSPSIGEIIFPEAGDEDGDYEVVFKNSGTTATPVINGIDLGSEYQVWKVDNSDPNNVSAAWNPIIGWIYFSGFGESENEVRVYKHPTDEIFFIEGDVWSPLIGRGFVSTEMNPVIEGEYPGVSNPKVDFQCEDDGSSTAVVSWEWGAERDNAEYVKVWFSEDGVPDPVLESGMSMDTEDGNRVLTVTNRDREVAVYENMPHGQVFTVNIITGMGEHGGISQQSPVKSVKFTGVSCKDSSSVDNDGKYHIPLTAHNIDDNRNLVMFRQHRIPFPTDTNIIYKDSAGNLATFVQGVEYEIKRAAIDETTGDAGNPEVIKRFWWKRDLSGQEKMQGFDSMVNGTTATGSSTYTEKNDFPGPVSSISQEGGGTMRDIQLNEDGESVRYYVYGDENLEPGTAYQYTIQANAIYTVTDMNQRVIARERVDVTGLNGDYAISATADKTQDVGVMEYGRETYPEGTSLSQLPGKETADNSPVASKYGDDETDLKGQEAITETVTTTTNECESNPTARSFSDSWNTSTTSIHRGGRYAKYYLLNTSGGNIYLNSSTDPYLYAYNGSSFRADDDGGSGLNSRMWVPAGTYCLEATTYGYGALGSFNISMSGSGYMQRAPYNCEGCLNPTVTTTTNIIQPARDAHDVAVKNIATTVKWENITSNGRDIASTRDVDSNNTNVINNLIQRIESLVTSGSYSDNKDSWYWTVPDGYSYTHVSNIRNNYTIEGAGYDPQGSWYPTQNVGSRSTSYTSSSEGSGNRVDAFNYSRDSYSYSGEHSGNYLNNQSSLTGYAVYANTNWTQEIQDPIYSTPLNTSDQNRASWWSRSCGSCYNCSCYFYPPSTCSSKYWRTSGGQSHDNSCQASYVRLADREGSARSTLNSIHVGRKNVKSGDIALEFQGWWSNCSHWRDGRISCSYTSSHSTCSYTYTCNCHSCNCVTNCGESGCSVSCSTCCSTCTAYYCCNPRSSTRYHYQYENARCNQYYTWNSLRGGWWQKTPNPSDNQTNYLPYDPGSSTSTYSLELNNVNFNFPQYSNKSIFLESLNQAQPSYSELTTYLQRKAGNNTNASNAPEYVAHAPGLSQKNITATDSSNAVALFVKDYSTRGVTGGNEVAWGGGANNAWENSLGGPFDANQVSSNAGITCSGANCTVQATGKTISLTYNIPGTYHDFGFVPVVYFTLKVKNVGSYDFGWPGEGSGSGDHSAYYGTPLYGIATTSTVGNIDTDMTDFAVEPASEVKDAVCDPNDRTCLYRNNYLGADEFTRDEFDNTVVAGDAVQISVWNIRDSRGNYINPRGIPRGAIARASGAEQNKYKSFFHSSGNQSGEGALAVSTCSGALNLDGTCSGTTPVTGVNIEVGNSAIAPTLLSSNPIAGNDVNKVKEQKLYFSRNGVDQSDKTMVNFSNSDLEPNNSNRNASMPNPAPARFFVNATPNANGASSGFMITGLYNLAGFQISTANKPNTDLDDPSYSQRYWAEIPARLFVLAKSAKPNFDPNNQNSYTGSENYSKLSLHPLQNSSLVSMFRRMYASENSPNNDSVKTALQVSAKNNPPYTDLLFNSSGRFATGPLGSDGFAPIADNHDGYVMQLDLRDRFGNIINDAYHEDDSVDLTDARVFATIENNQLTVNNNGRDTACDVYNNLLDSELIRRSSLDNDEESSTDSGTCSAVKITSNDGGINNDATLANYYWGNGSYSSALMPEEIATDASETLEDSRTNTETNVTAARPPYYKSTYQSRLISSAPTVNYASDSLSYTQDEKIQLAFKYKILDGHSLDGTRISSAGRVNTTPIDANKATYNDNATFEQMIHFQPAMTTGCPLDASNASWDCGFVKLAGNDPSNYELDSDVSIEGSRNERMMIKLRNNSATETIQLPNLLFSAEGRYGGSRANLDFRDIFVERLTWANISDAFGAIASGRRIESQPAGDQGVNWFEIRPGNGNIRESWSSKFPGSRVSACSNPQDSDAELGSIDADKKAACLGGYSSTGDFSIAPGKEVRLVLSGTFRSETGGGEIDGGLFKTYLAYDLNGETVRHPGGIISSGDVPGRDIECFNTPTSVEPGTTVNLRARVTCPGGVCPNLVTGEFTAPDSMAGQRLDCYLGQSCYGELDTATNKATISWNWSVPDIERETYYTQFSSGGETDTCRPFIAAGEGDPNGGSCDLDSLARRPINLGDISSAAEVVTISGLVAGKTFSVETVRKDGSSYSGLPIKYRTGASSYVDLPYSGITLDSSSIDLKIGPDSSGNNFDIIFLTKDEEDDDCKPQFFGTNVGVTCPLDFDIIPVDMGVEVGDSIQVQVRGSFDNEDDTVSWCLPTICNGVNCDNAEELVEYIGHSDLESTGYGKCFEVNDVFERQSILALQENVSDLEMKAVVHRSTGEDCLGYYQIDLIPPEERLDGLALLGQVRSSSLSTITVGDTEREYGSLQLYELSQLINKNVSNLIKSASEWANTQADDLTLSDPLYLPSGDVFETTDIKIIGGINATEGSEWKSLKDGQVVYIKNRNLVIGDSENAGDGYRKSIIFNDSLNTKMPLTFIVEGGDLIIKNNMEYGEGLNTTPSVGFIVLQNSCLDQEISCDLDDEARGGNIYLDPAVTDIVGSYYAEGSFMSAQDNYASTNELYSRSNDEIIDTSCASNDGKICDDEIFDGYTQYNNALSNQLYFQGLLISRNTVRGSSADGSDVFELPFGTIDESTSSAIGNRYLNLPDRSSELSDLHVFELYYRDDADNREGGCRGRDAGPNAHLNCLVRVALNLDNVYSDVGLRNQIQKTAVRYDLAEVRKFKVEGSDPTNEGKYAKGIESLRESGEGGSIHLRNIIIRYDGLVQRFTPPGFESVQDIFSAPTR